jgi:hypothetical protein
MHYDGLLGTDISRDCLLDFAQLIDPVDGLDALEAHFSADEIWNAVKRMTTRKAPGPDGFTAEFLRAGWSQARVPSCVLESSKTSWMSSSSCMISVARAFIASTKP